MDAYTIIAIIFVIIAAAILISVTKSKASETSVPKVTISEPIREVPKTASSTASPGPVPLVSGSRAITPPDIARTKPVPVDDSSGKWIHTKAKEKFVPQDTVYEYRRMSPCMLCPVCDAENSVGSFSCQVCGMVFKRGV